MNSLRELFKTITVITVTLCVSIYLPIAPMWQPMLAVTLLVVFLSWLRLKVLLTSVIVALIFMLLPSFIFVLGVHGTMLWYSAFQYFVVDTISDKSTLVFSFAGFIPIVAYLIRTHRVRRKWHG